MKIETKFNPGQTVFYKKKNKIKEDKIDAIGIDANEKEVEITYFFRRKHNWRIVDQSKVFASKEDFLKQLETESE